MGSPPVFDSGGIADRALGAVAQLAEEAHENMGVLGRVSNLYFQSRCFLESPRDKGRVCHFTCEDRSGLALQFET